MCFQGKYTNENKEDKKEEQDRELNIYELMAMALRLGIRMDDFSDMDFPLLVNLLDASIPKQEKKQTKYKEATQEDIEFYT